MKVTHRCSHKFRRPQQHPWILWLSLLVIVPAVVGYGSVSATRAAKKLHSRWRPFGGGPKPREWGEYFSRFITQPVMRKAPASRLRSASRIQNIFGLTDTLFYAPPPYCLRAHFFAPLDSSANILPDFETNWRQRTSTSRGLKALSMALSQSQNTTLTPSRCADRESQELCRSSSVLTPLPWASKFVPRLRWDENIKGKPSSEFVRPADTATRGWRASVCCWKVITTADTALSLLWVLASTLACVCRVHHGVCVRQCNRGCMVQGWLTKLPPNRGQIDCQQLSRVSVCKTTGSTGFLKEWDFRAGIDAQTVT